MQKWVFIKNKFEFNNPKDTNIYIIKTTLNGSLFY